MIRSFLLTFLLGGILAACQGPELSDVQTETLLTAEEVVALPDPFETYYPWDDTRDDLVTTPSGLQYIQVSAGPQLGQKPGLNDRVSVHYDGRLAEDGTQFDSSFSRGEPVGFGLSEVIMGWTEVLQLMVPGDEFMVYLPSDLAYGETGTPGGPIGPNADLIFRIYLLETLADAVPGAEYFSEHTPWDASDPKVQSTASGLQYIVLNAGDPSGLTPGPLDKVKHNFELRKAADNRRLETTFDKDAPTTQSLNTLFPGWAEALQLMRPGDDWLVYLPPALAFGDADLPGLPIGPNDNILMRLEFIETITPEVSDSAAWDKYTPWNREAPERVRTASGLEYIVLESGADDQATPVPTSLVEVYYEGRLARTGEVFDSAYARGEPTQFGVTQVISGWTEALQLMRPGDRWLVFLPAELAYGDSPRPGGIIQPGDDLIFEVQLMGVQ